MFKVIRYTNNYRQAWDQFVDKSLNSTFLHKRDYLEYHKDRFKDYSLLIMKEEEIVAMLPGSPQGDIFSSHPGLTYGGLIITPHSYTLEIIDIFKSIIFFLKESNFKKLYYKCIPCIYYKHINQSDLYAFYRFDSKIVRRDLNTVISFQDIKLPTQERRLRAAKKAQKSAVIISQSDNWAGFYQILYERLFQRYKIKPVHDLNELIYLSSMFPANIKLFIASDSDTIIAGILIFETSDVVHTQYIISTDEGFKIGALDSLFFYLIDLYKSKKKFFSFGISTTEEGKMLNEGLIAQKEGFGARSIVQDHYLLDLTELYNEY